MLRQVADLTGDILCPAGKMALPWALLLLLLGFQAQGAHAWCSEKDKLYIDKPVSDPDIVKFAVSAFNNQNKDEYAYRPVHIMSFSKVQVGDLVHYSYRFLMESARQSWLDICSLWLSYI